MVRFSKLHKKVEILNNEENKYILNDDNTFESKIGEVKVVDGQLVFEFFLLYKEYIFLGDYVYSEKLDDFSLQGFALQYDQINSVKQGTHEFEYKLQSLNKEQPKFYFYVGLKKDNPFV